MTPGKSSLVEQAGIYYCDFDPPIKARPVLVLSRTELNAVRENVIVALITRTVRNIPTEVALGKAEGTHNRQMGKGSRSPQTDLRPALKKC